MIGRLWHRWKASRENRRKERTFQLRRNALKRTDFAILANNCWGGEVYKYYNLPFNTPFIGLFLYPDCFIRLLENWDSIDLQAITLGHVSRYSPTLLSYPVGILAHDIEVHFLHYHSLEEAESKWKRRASRMKSAGGKDRIFVKFCDRDGATDEHFQRFAQLDFPHRVSFSVCPYPDPNHRVSVPDPKNDKQVDDGVKLFWHEMERGFDLPAWLNGTLFPFRN